MFKMTNIREDLRKRIRVMLREDHEQDIYGYDNEEEIVNIALEEKLVSMEGDLNISKTKPSAKGSSNKNFKAQNVSPKDSNFSDIFSADDFPDVGDKCGQAKEKDN